MANKIVMESKSETKNQLKKITTVDSSSIELVKEIHFYRASEKPYGVFSNLYKRELVMDEVVYPTAEHAYQAGKPRKDSVREWILSAPSPALVAMAAHGLYTWDINADWAKIKFDRMKRVLLCKFNQSEDFKSLLLSTSNSRLVESATVDNAVNRLWGEVKGKGQNKLGELLMEVRQELIKIELEKSQSKKTSLSKGKSEVAKVKKSKSR